MDAPGDFLDPDRRFRPAAFWFWHHLPDRPEISARLAEIAVSGLGTILIQARLGLPLGDYLSPAFLDAYRFAAAEAVRLGIGIEIYDEYNWMSGHGGGRTVEGANHLRERHLFWASGRIEDGRLRVAIEDIRSPFLEFLGPEGLAWCYEGGAPQFDEWTFVAATDETGAALSGDLKAAIEPAGSCACRIEIAVGDRSAEGATATVFVSARCATSRLVNYLLPETAERFTQCVYAPLVEAAGGAARAIFFDHPYAGFYRWRGIDGDLGNSLLWDAGLPADLGPEPLGLQLRALIADVGPQTAGLRARFFAAYGTRLHEAFFGTLRRWCDAHGIELTGHELLTHVGGWDLRAGLPGIDPRSMPGVDHFGIDRFRTETAVDAADFRPQLAARLGDSVARANGRSRCTIEQYATGRETGVATTAGHWGLTLEALRAQSIRHTLFGARRILLHALYLDDGFAPGEQPGANPRFDFPPGYNFQSWWADAPALFTELARLSAFLEEGQPIRPVALLYPLETIRADGNDPDCARHFGLWAEALAEAGIGYDIVDESAFAQASIDGDRLRLASGRYRTLILPAVTTLQSRRSAELIAGFAEAGGQLLASGPPATKARVPGEGEAVAALLSRAMKAERARSVEGEPLADAITRTLATGPAPMFRMADGPSWSAAAEHQGAIRIAAFNDADEARTAILDLGPGNVRIERWHAITGECEVLGVWQGGPVLVEMAASALLCLVLTSTSAAPGVPPTRDAVPLPAAIPLDCGWLFSNEGSDGPFQPIETDRGWERQGFATFTGTGIYRRTIDLPALPAGFAWHLILPGLRDVAVCSADGRAIGRRIAGEAAFALPVDRPVTEIELAIRNTAANRYYAGTDFAAAGEQPSGLVQPPRLEPRLAGASDIRIRPFNKA